MRCFVSCGEIMEVGNGTEGTEGRLLGDDHETARLRGSVGAQPGSPHGLVIHTTLPFTGTPMKSHSREDKLWKEAVVLNELCLLV